MASRKGSVRDILPTLAIVPSVALSLWVAGKLHSAIFATRLGGGPAQKATAAALGNMDLLVLGLTLSFFVFAIILAYKIPAHPAALPISFIFLVIVVFAGTQISNVWITIASTQAFKSTIGMFPLTKLIMLHFPKILGVLGLVIIFVQYSSGGPETAERRAL